MLGLQEASPIPLTVLKLCQRLGYFFLTHVTIPSNQIFPFQTHHRTSHVYDFSCDENGAVGALQYCPQFIIQVVTKKCAENLKETKLPSHTSTFFKISFCKNNRFLSLIKITQAHYKKLWKNFKDEIKTAHNPIIQRLTTIYILVLVSLEKYTHTHTYTSTRVYT